MVKIKAHEKFRQAKSEAAPAKNPKAKAVDPVQASIDVATRTMLRRARELGIDTVFDRVESMKPCAIGVQGTCCKNCGMGPSRLPLPKSGVGGEDPRKGLCGASANTIAARKESHDYRIKDTIKLLAIAPYFDVPRTVEVNGETVDRDPDEIALEVAEKALGEWGKSEGELLYLKRAPKTLYEKWKEKGEENHVG